VRDARSIRLVFLLTLTSGLLGRTAIELLPAVSGQLLGGDSTILAKLTAAAGAGSILGGLIVSRQSGRLERLFTLVLFGLSIAAFTLLTAGLWNNTWLVAGAIALISLCTTMIGTGCQAMVQLSVDETYRGRVMSLWTVIAMGAPALGALLIGSAADSLGFPLAFGVTAVLALAVVARARPRGPELRR
jgi:MFS family permease